MRLKLDDDGLRIIIRGPSFLPGALMDTDAGDFQ